MTRFLWQLRYANGRRTLCELPELWNMGHKLVAIRANNKMASVGSSRNSCATIGISQPSQRYMPRDFAWYATVWEVEAESYSKIRQIWRTSFYIDGCVNLRTVALRQPIFKQEKWWETIRLGLNYCSIGSSQPPSPSRDTRPLTCHFLL
jgi:hypothetical protein